jgi:hypothetical protein
MTRATLLSRPWRLVAAFVATVASATLPTYMLALVLLPPVPAIVMIRSFAVGTALPAIVAWAIIRIFAGAAEVRDGMLHLRRADLDVRVPCATITPCARGGSPCRCRASTSSSGRTPGCQWESRRHISMRCCARSPHAASIVTAIRRRPSVVYATTRPVRRWIGPILKFAVFGTLPASLFFYTHQWIAYGGPLGQYYLEGTAPYLRTFAEYWMTTVVLLISYASVWRAVAELVVWTTGALRAEWAPPARRVADAVCALAYYGGVPLVLALRYQA